jgi:hypothetical protein
MYALSIFIALFRTDQQLLHEFQPCVERPRRECELHPNLLKLERTFFRKRQSYAPVYLQLPCIETLGIITAAPKPPLRFHYD